MASAWSVVVDRGWTMAWWNTLTISKWMWPEGSTVGTSAMLMHGPSLAARAFPSPERRSGSMGAVAYPPIIRQNNGRAFSPLRRGLEPCLGQVPDILHFEQWRVRTFGEGIGILYRSSARCRSFNPFRHLKLC